MTETKERPLNPKHELFCQLYVSGERELFGNGTLCYLEVYGSKDEGGKKMSYMAAAAAASRLLKNVKIINRVNELLETGGFNAENVDKQHLFLINQFSDLKTKMAAIKEFNALKNRISNKLDITSDGKQIGVVYLPQKQPVPKEE